MNLPIVAETRHKLVALFPKCFMPAGSPKLPLKIGIFADVRARCKQQISYKNAKMALKDYTRGLTYIQAMVEGASRFDLDGNESGVVTADEAEYYRLLATRIKNASAFYTEMKRLRTENAAMKSALQMIVSRSNNLTYTFTEAARTVIQDSIEPIKELVSDDFAASRSTIPETRTPGYSRLQASVEQQS